MGPRPRALRPGRLDARHLVIETVGTQEYELDRSGFLRAVRRGLRRRGGGRGRAAPAHRPRLTPRRAPVRRAPGRAAAHAVAARARPRPSRARTSSASAPTSSRAPCSPATARGLFPMGLGGRGGRRSAGGRPTRAGVLPLDGAARQPARCARSRGRFEVRVDTAFDAVVRGLRRPRPRRPLDHPRGRRAPTRGCTALGWAHSVESWQDGELVGGLYGVAVGGLFAGESMFHRVTRRLEGRAARPGRRARAPSGRPAGCSTCSGAPTTWPRSVSSRCRARSTWPGARGARACRCRRPGPDCRALSPAGPPRAPPRAAPRAGPTSSGTRVERQRDPHVAVGQHAHRRQHVARGQRRARCTPSRRRPRSRAGPARRAAPRRRRTRHEKVTTCGSRSTGSPTDLDVGHGRSAAQPGRPAGAASRGPGRPAARGVQQRRGRGQHRRHVRPRRAPGPARLVRGPSRRHRTPVRDGEHADPRPGRPTAGVRRQHVPARAGRRRGRPRAGRRPAAGRPRDRSDAAATGCRVPTSPLAPAGTAAAVSRRRRRPRRTPRGRPGRGGPPADQRWSVRRGSSRRCAAARSARPRRAPRAPDPPAAGSSPRSPSWRAGVARRRERHARPRRAPSAGGDRLAGAVEQRPGPAALACSRRGSAQPRPARRAAPARAAGTAGRGRRRAAGRGADRHGRTATLDPP